MKNSRAISLFFASCVLTSVAVGQIVQKSKNALTYEYKQEELVARLKEGFHFNEKAPNKVVVDGVSFKPTLLTHQEIKFSQLPKGKNTQASLFVCDNDLTTCEMHSLNLKGKPEKAGSGLAAKAAGKVNKFGFIEDDLQQALNVASQKKSLVLIDFSARWCPGCVRLENEIFTNDEFKKITARYVKVKIDTDRFENIVIKEKFKVIGVPTLLVINSQQEEVDRIVDYQPFSRIKEFLQLIDSEPTPLAKLMARNDLSGRKRLQLARRLIGANRFQEALTILEKDQKQPEYLTAKVGLAQDNYKQNKDKKALITQLKEAIESESQSTRSLLWRSSLVEVMEPGEERTKIVTEGVQLADQLLEDPNQLKKATETDQVGEFTGFEAFMVAILRADLITSGEPDGESEKALSAWKKAANVGTAAKIDAKKQGTALRYLIVLNRAHLWLEADALARQMIARYPENVDLHRRRLRPLLEMKKYSEGIRVGKNCLANSYGQNEFWCAEMLAKTYLAANKKKEAKALIDRYLAKPEIEWSSIKTSKDRLQELMKQTM